MSASPRKRPKYCIAAKWGDGPIPDSRSREGAGGPRAVGQADKSLAAAAIDDRAAAATARYLADRQAQADAQLQALAGTLESGGDSQAAREVARARSHSDGALAARQEKLRARGDTGARPADQPSGQGR